MNAAGAVEATYVYVTRANVPDYIVTSAGVVFGFPLFTSVAMRYVEAVHASVIVGILPLATALVGAMLRAARVEPFDFLQAVDSSFPGLLADADGPTSRRAA